ncbi:NadS family protein [Saccharibacillus alkalitolerans]|uniref:Helix-turn-helix domain-containing protein n=1 Tax=Saccharibacillus alkalitolerans TaxID=2705290 RepID=A0ABX0FAL9_9BACL|nr:NadS family protein [Saccharibacillus alkalitolerans]NGZ77987.1 helix-turn-helix domain-containing protein [Saccharibacillus alkalitolerans]
MSSSYYNALEASLNEAVEFAKGDPKKGTVRELKFKPLPKFSKAEVKEIRTNTHLSAAAFANVLGVSVKTVEAWETGTSNPTGSSQRFLQVLKEKPEFAKEFILS